MTILTTLAASAAIAVAVPMAILYLYPEAFLNGVLKLRKLVQGVTDKTLRISGDRIFSYSEAGDRNSKNIFLLFHGFSSRKEDIFGAGHLLTSLGRVIAVDMPGHGESTRTPAEAAGILGQVKQLREFVDTLLPEGVQVHLLGLSMGGHVAGCFAALHPDRIRTVTLCCPAGVKTESLTPYQKTVFENPGGGPNTLIPRTLDEVDVLISSVCEKPIKLPGPIKAAILSRYNRNRENNEAVFAQITNKENIHLLMSYAHLITKPCLILWGQHDRILDVAGADVLHRLIPNSTKVIIANAGHSLDIEAPKSVFHAVKALVMENANE